MEVYHRPGRRQLRYPAGSAPSVEDRLGGHYQDPMAYDHLVSWLNLYYLYSTIKHEGGDCQEELEKKNIHCKKYTVDAKVRHLLLHKFGFWLFADWAGITVRKLFERRLFIVYAVSYTHLEVIILPESKSVSKRDLTALVQEVNDTQLEEEEILSDRVYYYDREYKLLRI